MSIFEKIESEVRGYCRTFHATFEKAEGWHMYDEHGRQYLDFFAGAGSLNYGHNHPILKQRLLDYIGSSGVSHSLDMYTIPKRKFLERFQEVILGPRNMDYRVMFPGPTGTNAVEAALKLARKVTGRHNILCFTNAFHGMTLGSLSVTGNAGKRGGAGIPLGNSYSFPYDGYFGEDVDTVELLKKFLEDGSSGLDYPAAIILETTQAEGGVNVARKRWLQDLAQLAKEHDILLIVDDIQVGCGRTGPFFSFEEAGIQPDMITLSKSLSGFGLPFSLTLFKPQHDLWNPGEHNGTFRGNNLAFITAEASLSFWEDAVLTREVEDKARFIRSGLENISNRFSDLGIKVKGKGMIQGLDFADPEMAGKISSMAFEKGLIIETAGAKDQVLKLLPPLVISKSALESGMDIIEDCIGELTGKGIFDSETTLQTV